MKPVRISRSRSSVRVNSYPSGHGFFAVSIASLFIMLALGASAPAYGFIYADKIYPGITVLNTDIGGRTEEMAESLLQPRLGDLAKGELALHYGGKKWPTTLGEFGLRYDVQRTVVEGYSIGRRGSILDRLSEPWRALLRGHDAKPAVWFDRAAQEKVLSGIAASVDGPPVDAEVGLGPDGTVQIWPSQTGLKVDVEETLRRFENSFSLLSTKELSLAVQEITPEVLETDLAKAQGAGGVITGKPLTLKLDKKSWSMSQQDLSRLLRFSRVDKEGEKAVAYLDREMLSQYLAPIAAEIRQEPKDAMLRYSQGKILVIAGADGLALDIPASAAAIDAQATSPQREVVLVTKVLRPAIIESELGEARSIAEKMIAEPLTLKHGELSWNVSRTQLGEMLVFETREANSESGSSRGAMTDRDREGRKVVASFDKEGLRGVLERVGQRIAKPSRDARFRFENGKLGVVAEAVDGMKLDEAATIDNIIDSKRQGSHIVNVVTAVDKAKIQSSDKDKIVIKDRLMEAATSYAGGIAERTHNVELASSRLNGVVIPPGETFSMNVALGPATLAAGFKIGYGIAVSGTEMITVPSEAGGICQIATTLYHAVFAAGLPIVERLEHLYWIPRYGQPPIGKKGLDATVDAPWVDFKFKNTTPNWLAIQSRTDGSNVYFTLYGTKTGWEVKVDGPKITDIVPAEQEMVYEEDPTMPWGKQLLVEHAEDGFVATIVRTVYKDGKVIDTYKSVSRYRPSRNVTLIGTKGKPATPAAPDA